MLARQKQKHNKDGKKMTSAVVGVVAVVVAVVLFTISTSPSFVASQASTPAIQDCHTVSASLLSCSYAGADVADIDHACQYGDAISFTCDVPQNITCNGPRTFSVDTVCKYCYQHPLASLQCENSTDCNVFRVDSLFRSNCTARPSLFCLGSRAFDRNVACNWSSQTLWSTKLLYSLTLGGFGADRFYAGDIGHGLGKLFSFGGVGLWGVVDAVLAAVGFPTSNTGHLVQA